MVGKLLLLGTYMIMATCTNAEELKVESLLLQGQKLTSDELTSLKHLLRLMKDDDLRSLSKRLGV